MSYANLRANRLSLQADQLVGELERATGPLSLGSYYSRDDLDTALAELAPLKFSESTDGLPPRTWVRVERVTP